MRIDQGPSRSVTSVPPALQIAVLGQQMDMSELRRLTLRNDIQGTTNA